MIIMIVTDNHHRHHPHHYHHHQHHHHIINVSAIVENLQVWSTNVIVPTTDSSTCVQMKLFINLNKFQNRTVHLLLLLPLISNETMIVFNKKV